jgi:oxaloacetate decarboxylase alpha subunit
MRMRAYQAARALPYIDRTGYRIVDLTGAGMFTVLLRQFRDDPWASTDFLVKNLPNSTMRSGLRTISVIGFAHTPQVIIDLWAKTLIKHGVTSFWLFDCLYDLPTMKYLVDLIGGYGGQGVPAIMYGLTDVHDDEYFAAQAREMASWPGVDSIYFEDAAGVLTPQRASTLLPAIRAATGDRPLELHCHNTTNLAQLNYMEGIKAGFTIFHTATRPMANGPSLPSIDGMLPIVENLGHTHNLDVRQLAPVAENFLWAAEDAGYEIGVPAEYDPRIYDHQLPGGMSGTLKMQLANHGMADRLPQVLAEIPQVREELGQPIMATPFSQFVGIQAVLNVVTGKRWSMVPDETVHYAMGHYGPLRRPVHPDVMDKIMSVPRAAEIAKWERPNPTLKQIKSLYRSDISDEELLLRFMTSDVEVDQMLAKGPIRTDPDTAAVSLVRRLSQYADQTSVPTHISVSTPGLLVSVGRRSG